MEGSVLQSPSSGLPVYLQANTVAGGAATTITNSGGLSAMQSGLWTVSSTILNSGGWIVSASATILNSAGWIVNVANTGGVVILSGGSTSIINTAGWLVYAIDSAATGTATTNITSTIGTVVLAAAQVKRTNLAIYNASTQVMYMKLGSGAKSTDFTLMMVGSGYYELPRPVYNGQITGVWPTADGFAMVSETT